MCVLLYVNFSHCKKIVMCILAQQPGPWFRFNELIFPDARIFLSQRGYIRLRNHIQLHTTIAPCHILLLF